MNKIKSQTGFTLIEILIALFIFAILATITTHAIKDILEKYRHIQQHFKTWYDLDRLINNLQYQTMFYVKRSIKANEGHRFPAFIGQHDYVEWTYHAASNVLIRIAYLCQGGQLKFRQWMQLDTLSRDQFRETTLLTGLSECSFRYLNNKNQMSGYWTNEFGISPLGLQVTFKWPTQKRLQLWYTLPPVIYEQPANT